MSAKHTTIRLLSELSNRNKWGKEHHILASNTARFLHQSTPFFLPFPFPFSLPLSHQFIIPPLTTTPASPQALAHSPYKQASKRPCRFRRFRNFLIGTTQPTSHLFTDIPTYKRREIKYFGVILPMRIDSYALLAARHARGDFLLGTMHVK